MAATDPANPYRDVLIVDIDRTFSPNLSDASEDSLAEPANAEGKSQEVVEVSPERALAMYVALNLTKWAYVTDVILKNYKRRYRILSFPKFSELVKEKRNCYPNREDVLISKTSARIRLQGLMDLTTKRLLASLDIDFDETKPKRQFKLISKWGFDRSASQSLCHKKRDEMAFNFMICVVPLQLVSNDVTVWRNERPCSASYCRPVLFKFMKYNKQNVRAELQTVQAEIDALFPTILDGIIVSHQFMSKVMDIEYHSVTPQSVASVCTVCKATAIKNNPHMDSIKERQPNNNMNTYGLSSLQAWIRSMESLLELSYRFDVKSWQPKTIAGQRKVNRRRKQTQTELRFTRFLLDINEQTFESLYKGNSARHFFKHGNIYNLLTNIDEELLERICVILQCLSSGRKVILPKFREYCHDTATLYMELYPWYYMPYPLHKLLIHGPDHVENYTVIPIGTLCEGITEATDREYWKYKKCLMKKFPIRMWNVKILFHLLLSSDPLLTSIQPKVKSSWFKHFFDLTYPEKTSSISRAVNEADLECSDDSEFGDDFDDDENEQDF